LGKPGGGVSKRYKEPVAVWLDARGQPAHFTWRKHTYHVRVILSWKLQDRWWDKELFSDRTYFRVLTKDHQAFDLYWDAAHEGVWILDVVHD
jgi:Domain of unknown function (DUF6504)